MAKLPEVAPPAPVAKAVETVSKSKYDRMTVKTIHLGLDRTAGIFLPENVTSEEMGKILAELLRR